jgi:hypothetical protein
LIVRSNPLGLVLIALGAGGFVLGVIFPLVSEVELGIPGLSLKLSVTVNRRETMVRDAISPETRRISRKFAELLTGDKRFAGQLLQGSLDHAMVEWTGGGQEELLAQLLCEIVRSFLSPLSIVASDSDQENAIPSAKPLRALSGLQRAVLLLHDQAGLSIPAIARIVSPWSIDVSADLDAAHSLLAAAVS